MRKILTPSEPSIFGYLSWLAVIALLFGVPALAQAQGKFIKENQVTEEAMISALKPSAAKPSAEEPSDETGPKTRSLRVTPGVAAKKPPAAKSEDQKSMAARANAGQASQGSAPVLLTFETNSSELTARAKKALDIIAKSLMREELIGLRFAVEGHADPRGDIGENMQLSTARAQAVKAYLVGVHHIQENRLQAIGKGSTELAYVQNPAAPENRRVTFVTLQN